MTQRHDREERVLLMEDDLSAHAHLEELFARLGYHRILCAASRDAAERHLAPSPPDIALLNVDPGDGLQSVLLGRRLAQRGTRVLFMSALTGEHMARATRGFECLEKPLSLSRLKAALHRARLRLRAHRSAMIAAQ